MGDSVSVRIPVLENLATQFGHTLSQHSRLLTTRERGIAQSVFEESVNYNQVRIVTATVAAAPTTLGNNIRIPPGFDLIEKILIHEMMHIWQFQTQGNGYISNSAVHQTMGMITGGSRNAAYTYTIVPGQSINRYTAEHQAMIVQDYYDIPALQSDLRYIKLITEVRQARPVLTNADRYEESLYGSGSQNRSLGHPLQNPNDRRSGVIPIIRLEF